MLSSRFVAATKIFNRSHNSHSSISSKGVNPIPTNSLTTSITIISICKQALHMRHFHINPRVHSEIINNHYDPTSASHTKDKTITSSSLSDSTTLSHSKLYIYVAELEILRVVFAERKCIQIQEQSGISWTHWIEQTKMVFGKLESSPTFVMDTCATHWKKSPVLRTRDMWRSHSVPQIYYDNCSREAIYIHKIHIYIYTNQLVN